MKHFLIQVSETDGQVLHDFAFRLLDALRYAKWRHPEPIYSHSFAVSGETVQDLKQNGIQVTDIVPIGSLEFVMNRMNDLEINGVEKIKPLNIPPSLDAYEFLGRTHEAGLTKDELLQGDRAFPLFIKSAGQYKGFTDILEFDGQLKGLSAVERYDVSEAVDIQAEWRVFVQRDEIIAAKSYGNNDLFPKPANTRLLQRMTKTIEQARRQGIRFPVSYTLDVGVSMEGTFLIECHPFVSCGLYGFDDLERLPSMMIQGYQYFREETTI